MVAPSSQHAHLDGHRGNARQTQARCTITAKHPARLQRKQKGLDAAAVGPIKATRWISEQFSPTPRSYTVIQA